MDIIEPLILGIVMIILGVLGLRFSLLAIRKKQMRGDRYSWYVPHEALAVQGIADDITDTIYTATTPGNLLPDARGVYIGKAAVIQGFIGLGIFSLWIILWLFVTYSQVSKAYHYSMLLKQIDVACKGYTKDTCPPEIWQPLVHTFENSPNGFRTY